jgi:hypothetical protein
MRYFLDTEFNGFGGGLISLALVPESDTYRTYHNEDIPLDSLYLATICKNPEPWVAENVIPLVDIGNPEYVPISQFGHKIAEYFRVHLYMTGDPRIEIITDWPDDIRYFCECLITKPGEMVNLGSFAFQMIRVDAYPTTLPGAVQHNALWDARALRHLFVD